MHTLTNDLDGRAPQISSEAMARATPAQRALMRAENERLASWWASEVEQDYRNRRREGRSQ